jgi:hypothetical protein
VAEACARPPGRGAAAGAAAAAAPTPWAPHWPQALDEQRALELYQHAYDAAAAEQQQEAQAAAGGDVGSLPQPVQAQLLQLKVRSRAGPWAPHALHTQPPAAAAMLSAGRGQALPCWPAFARACPAASARCWARAAAGDERGASHPVPGVGLLCRVW